MDIRQAQTFMAVCETRSFVVAAERVHVSQSTVSTRIKSLEDELGCTLFERNKSGVVLTAAGVHFRPHATAFLRLWAQARQEAALPRHYATRLNIGGQSSHWDYLMVEWIAWLVTNFPDIAVHAETATSEILMHQLTEGLLDLAVVYAPQADPGLVIEKLFDETLILVSATRVRGCDNGRAVPSSPGHVFVDWGRSFLADYALAWPELEPPALHFQMGSVALSYILRCGGSGYFPMRMVYEHIKGKRLFRVPGAPSFKRPVYLVASRREPDERFGAIIQGLHDLGAETAKRANS